MSQRRQTSPIGDGFAARSLSLTFRDRHRIESHVHPWAQLVYASSGLMRVSTTDVAWLVPSTRAIWLPAGERHAIEMRGTTTMRTLYVAPSWSEQLPPVSRALEVQPLLRELVLYIAGIGMLDPTEPSQRRLADLLVDLVGQTGTSPLSLPLPRDKRARRLAERLLDDPADRLPIERLAAVSGASLRTLQRLFPAETGLTPDAWRIRAKLQHAVVLLTEGDSVTEAALASGYGGPSAFISAFRRSFGQTPGRFRPSAGKR
jgi:AraC-like DNA-binding protein/quercetin dioxygenase-like cupin family protein